MGNYLNIGNDGFSSAAKGIYVDKTEMISYMNSILGTKDKLICASRPRRFGKTIAAKMLSAYYDKSCDSRGLFVYNPNSVMQAIKREQFGSYWTRTETYESLKVYIDLDLDGLKEALVRMLAGERVKIMTGSFQNVLTSIGSKDDVLTLLVHLGYLAYDAKEEKVFIPNEEVRQEFVLAVSRSHHREVVKLIRNSDDFTPLSSTAWTSGSSLHW